MAYQIIQVPTYQEINSNFTTLQALNLDTKEKFVRNISISHPQLEKLLTQSEFQEVITKGFDSSNRKYDYNTLLTEFIQTFVKNEKVLIVDYEHLTLPTYKQNMYIYPKNVRNIFPSDIFPNFKVPIIYIVKRHLN